MMEPPIRMFFIIETSEHFSTRVRVHKVRTGRVCSVDLVSLQLEKRKNTIKWICVVSMLNEGVSISMRLIICYCSFSPP